MGFKVILEPSGHSFEVEPGQKILKGGLAAGCSMPYGCRMGTCSTCRGKVISGRVDFGDVHPSYLTEADKKQGFVLLCQAKALSDLVLEVKELPRQHPAQTFPAMVRSISKPTPDVAVVNLRVPLHLNLRYLAGQYVDILLEDGLRRSYSIATTPAVPPEASLDLQLHIRHMSGGIFTDRLFLEGIEPRSKLQVEGPLGTFFLRDETDKPIIFLASGTGYAPIRSILLDMMRSEVKRQSVLYWGGRSKQDIYLMDEAREWAQVHRNLEFVPVLSDPKGEDQWSGRTGFVHHAVMEDFPDLSQHEVYACGAPVMVNAARSDFTTRRGLPAEAFIADSFVTQADVAAAENQGVVR